MLPRVAIFDTLAGVAVTDVGREEFGEAILRALAGRGDEGRGFATGEGDELVHVHTRFASKSNFAAFSSRTSLSFQPSPSSMSV
jgi:hypothetical protein